MRLVKCRPQHCTLSFGAKPRHLSPSPPPVMGRNRRCPARQGGAGPRRSRPGRRGRSGPGASRPAQAPPWARGGGQLAPGRRLHALPGRCHQPATPGPVRPEARLVPSRAAGLPLLLAPMGSGSGLGGGRGSAVTHRPPPSPPFPRCPDSRGRRDAAEPIGIEILALWFRSCAGILGAVFWAGPAALSAVCSPDRSRCCILPGARSWRGCAARPSRCRGRSPLCSSGRRSSRSTPGMQQVTIEVNKETWI